MAILNIMTVNDFPDDMSELLADSKYTEIPHELMLIS